ncbi:hypothetical protein PC128_g669 [Phytophthora cactorum]|nr:hypothetical protein PC128_g669 [Phytophthora cactorum]
MLELKAGWYLQANGSSSFRPNRSQQIPLLHFKRADGTPPPLPPDKLRPCDEEEKGGIVED